MTEHDQGDSPVPQEMARLVYERLEAIQSTQRLHGTALGSILTRLDGHDAQLEALRDEVRNGFVLAYGRMDALEEKADRLGATVDSAFTSLKQQMQTNHEGVMALLTELVGKKT